MPTRNAYRGVCGKAALAEIQIELGQKRVVSRMRTLCVSLFGTIHLPRPSSKVIIVWFCLTEVRNESRNQHQGNKRQTNQKIMH